VKVVHDRRWLHHFLLLLLWTAVGLALRFTNLTAKPLWTDEFSTIVFSLGNSFLTVPLDQIITLKQLLQPLQPNPEAGVGAVIEHLLDESNHPPLYFVLSYFWLKLFPLNSDGLVTAWTVRSLPALLGTASIPAAFGLGWAAFRSRLVGQIAAALMAVSPFGLYLAQEARHYTLPILWVIASLCCLVTAARTLRDRVFLPLWICIVWIIVNGLGLATHYFFTFTLLSEILVIVSLGLVQSWRERGIWYPSAHWTRIWAVAAGTIMSGLVWWPALQNLQEGDLIRWIYRGDRTQLAYLEPIGQAVAGWITMLYLLPVQVKSQWIVAASGIALVLLMIWTVPKLYRGLKVQYLERESRLGVLVLGGFVGGAVLLFFGVTYFFNADLTSTFRYNFVYFPAVMVLAGAGLASSWNVAIKIAQAPAVEVPEALLNLIRTSSRKTVVLIWLISLLGGWMVVSNCGYQKNHRPDVVAEAIRQGSQETVLVAIAHQTHGQIGRLMGIAWDLQQSAQALPTLNPYFLLANTAQNAQSVIPVLRQALSQFPRPLDLWLINFQDVPEQSRNLLLEQQNCVAGIKTQSVDGYRYRLYRCGKTNASGSDSDF
jgi:uncharacterized membrane protein